MKQADFAQLCGITQQMVSKYLADGRVVQRADGRIDPTASLDALAGHLDEDKRAHALAKLEFIATGGADLPTDAPRAPVAPSKSSPKAEHDAIKRDLAALELAQKSGQLISVDVVQDRIFDAVAKMRQAFEATQQSASERLAHDLGLAQDRVPLIRRHMKRGFTDAQAAFVAVLNADAALPVDHEAIAAE